MRTNEQLVTALGHAGYLDVRTWGSASTFKWAAIRSYAGGFAITSGDGIYVHNELWWFPTFPLARKSLEGWATGVGSPPPVARTGPCHISRKGKLKKWSQNE